MVFLPNLLLSSCFFLSPVSLCTAIAIVCVIPSKINKSGNCLDQKSASVYWVYIPAHSVFPDWYVAILQQPM